MAFGMLMGMMGILPMVGRSVHQDNALVSFGVYTLISTFIGRRVRGGGQPSAPIVVSRHRGVVNGVVWWVLGALILMPLGLGKMQIVLVISQTQWMSLMGHVLYGVSTAFVFVPLNKRL